MAKYECNFKGNFDEFLNIIEKEILAGSMSASYEDGSDYQIDNTRLAVRVYERFSAIGNNRVSLNITLVGNNNDLYLCAITSGGSQALIFKINTFGEEAFLKKLIEVVEGYQKR